MKTFFILFLCFLCLICHSFETQATSSSFGQDPKTQEKIAEILMHLQQLDTQAKNQLPQEAVFTENADKYNLFSPVHLMQTDASPLSGTKGYGTWTELPFGKARLISCYSGVRFEQNIFAALQIALKKDTFLKKPLLTSSSNQTEKPQFFYPIKYPLPPLQTKTENYADFSFFPLFATAQTTNKPFILDVTATLTGCEQENCQTVQVPLSLTLDADSSYVTGICPLMMTALQSVPKPLKESAVVSALKNTDGNIQLSIHFEKPTSLLSIQIENDWSFEILSKKNVQQTDIWEIKPTKPVADSETLNLKLITSSGYFDAPVVLQKGVFQEQSAQQSLLFLIFGGVLLFILTPVWPLFLIQHPKSVKSLKSTAKNILIALGLMTLLTAALWQINFFNPIDFIQESLIFMVISFVLLIVLSVRPTVSLMGALILFWFIPKPYLTPLFNTPTPIPFFVACWWGLILMCPFYLIYKNPQFFLTLFKGAAKAPKHLLLFARLPFIGLLIWFIIAASGNALINRTLIQYTPDFVSSALKQEKIVFVSVEQPVCFSCFWNKAVQMKTGYPRSFARIGKFEQVYVPANSAEGQKLRSLHPTNDLPLNLLYGPNNKDGLTLPTTLDYFKLKEYLNTVRQP